MAISHGRSDARGRRVRRRDDRAAGAERDPGV